MLYNNYHEALSDEYLYTEDHTALTMKPLVMGICTLKTTIRVWILLVTLMGISTSQRILPTLNGMCIF